MSNKRRKRPEGWPAWFFAGTINEAIFCQEFLADHKLVYTENAFFTPQGKMIDESPLQAEIYEIIEPFASTSVTKKISNIVGLMKISAHVDNLPPETDRIHVANGTLMLDGSFSTSMDQIVRCRFPIRYNPDAGEPTKWLHFLNQLLHPEDIPTLQEYVGYQCMLAVREQLMRKFGTAIGDRLIERVLCYGTDDINEKYLTVIQETARQYVAGIMRRLREHEYNPELMKLYIVGGGGCLIRSFGEYDPSRVTINDDICAMAKGYEFLAGLRLKKAGAA